jgi:hypothetical protein
LVECAQGFLLPATHFGTGLRRADTGGNLRPSPFSHTTRKGKAVLLR